MMCCSPGSDCFEWVKTIAPVIVTVIFGAIAGAITWRRYKVAQAKLKLDLFERRYKIFEELRTLHTNYHMPTPFDNFKPEAAFLFGKRKAYIDELADNWSELHRLELGEESPGPDNRKNAARKSELNRYFNDAINSGVMDRFSPFLDFANWK